MPIWPQKRIYFDYASLTPIDPRVIREMKKYSSMKYANASSIYKEGVDARNTIEKARTDIAGFIDAHSDEILFTSGGTESNNLAIMGALNFLLDKGVLYEEIHVVVSSIEHSSIIEIANHLKKKGVHVDFIPVNENGIVNIDILKKSLRPNTAIVSVMTVNNEIGTVQPIREIAKIVRDYRKSLCVDILQKVSVGDGSEQNTEKTSWRNKVLPEIANHYPLFHTDASQAGLFQELKAEKLGIQLMTLDAGKMYGPRGTGLLFKKRNVPLAPIIFGGGQEKGLRSGTENIPAIMGFAKAVEIAEKERKSETQRLQELKDLFIESFKTLRPDMKVHGEDADASPHIANVQIPKIDNEFFVLQLDAKGISCSTKSSCLRDADESYVLKAIGANTHTSVRFSFGRWSRKAHIRALIAILTNLC